MTDGSGEEPTFRPYQPPAQPSPEPGHPPTQPYGQSYGQPYSQPSSQPYRPDPHAQQPYWAAQPYAAPPSYPGGLMGYQAPYGVHPLTGRPLSDKTKVTAGLLQLLLPLVGICGVGRLYTGHLAIGLIQLIGFFVSFVLIFVLIGIPMIFGIWLWTVIDGVILLATDSTDADGRQLR